MTTQEQLDQLNAAISDIELNAQEYRTGDLHVKRANLETLYARRNELLQQLAEESTGTIGGVFVAQFDRR